MVCFNWVQCILWAHWCFTFPTYVVGSFLRGALTLAWKLHGFNYFGFLVNVWSLIIALAAWGLCFSRDSQLTIMLGLHFVIAEPRKEVVPAQPTSCSCRAGTFLGRGATGVWTRGRKFDGVACFVQKYELRLSNEHSMVFSTLLEMVLYYELYCSESRLWLHLFLSLCSLHIFLQHTFFSLTRKLSRYIIVKILCQMSFGLKSFIRIIKCFEN